MATPAGPEFGRVSWHRAGAIGILIGLFVIMLASILVGRLLHGFADGLFLLVSVVAVLVIYTWCTSAARRTGG